MNINKIIIIGIMALLPFFFNSQEKKIIKWGDVLKGHTHNLMAERIASEVKQKSNGRIEIQVYQGGQLGGSKDQVQAVSYGTQQVTMESAGILSSFLPSISVFAAPYVWRDMTHVYSVFNGSIGKDFIEKLIASSNIRILGVTYYGTRHLTTANKLVKNVKDMSGFKLRVQQNDVAIAAAKAWGAVPTPINFNELYDALKLKIVDGQENPLPTIYNSKFYSVQKYLVLTGHTIDARFIMINETFWKSLSSGDQKILKDAIDSGIKWANEQIVKQEKELLAKLKSEGMFVVEPNINEFKKAITSSLPKKFESQWGIGMYEKIASYK